MTLIQQIITILMIVLGTMLTRFLPFSSFLRKNRLLSMSGIWGNSCRPRSSDC